MNKSNPRVSVCVVTYNHVSFIEQCLESILIQQTDFPFEIILGEDESSDGTRAICKEYAEKFPDKIRLFLRSRKDVIYINGNPTGRYNFIENLKAAKGKYIALLEGDDYWTDPLKLQKQVDFMEKNEECFLINHAMPSLEVTKEGYYKMGRLFRWGYLPHASNYMFRKFDLGKYKAPLLNMLGGEMCMLYIAATEGLIYHSGEPVSFYRFNPNGIYMSKTKKKKIITNLIQLRLIKKYFHVDNQIYLEKRLDGFLELTRINPFYVHYILYYWLRLKQRRARLIFGNLLRCI